MRRKVVMGVSRDSRLHTYMSRSANAFDCRAGTSQISPGVKWGEFQRLLMYHRFLKGNLRPMQLRGYPEWFKVGATHET